VGHTVGVGDTEGHTLSRVDRATGHRLVQFTETRGAEGEYSAVYIERRKDQFKLDPELIGAFTDVYSLCSSH